MCVMLHIIMIRIYIFFIGESNSVKNVPRHLYDDILDDVLALCVYCTSLFHKLFFLLIHRSILHIPYQRLEISRVIVVLVVIVILVIVVGLIAAESSARLTRARPDFEVLWLLPNSTKVGD